MYSKSHLGRSSNGYRNVFHSINWENASFSERMSALQQLENDNANIQGRQPRTLIAEDMPPSYDAESESTSVTRGYYDYDSQPDKLYINKDMVENKGVFTDSSTGWVCAQNVTHEGFHAAQDDIIERREVDSDKMATVHADLTDVEKMSQDFETYTDDMADAMYAFRTSEYSARIAATQRVDELHEDVSETYGEDEAYEHLKERDQEIEAVRLEDANRLFGTQFSIDEMNKHVSSIVKQQYDSNPEVASEGDTKDTGKTDDGAEHTLEMTPTEGANANTGQVYTDVNALAEGSKPTEGTALSEVVERTAEVPTAEKNETEKDHVSTEASAEKEDKGESNDAEYDYDRGYGY